MDGQTVLDVGCYCGFFLHDAVSRGAIRAVGVEADDGRYEIASTIAQLWDGKVEVKHGLVQDVVFDEKFDYVLFLNVIHHLVAPVEVVKRVAHEVRIQ